MKAEGVVGCFLCAEEFLRGRRRQGKVSAQKNSLRKEKLSAQKDEIKRENIQTMNSLFIRKSKKECINL